MESFLNLESLKIGFNLRKQQQQQQNILNILYVLSQECSHSSKTQLLIVPLNNKSGAGFPFKSNIYYPLIDLSILKTASRFLKNYYLTGFYFFISGT